MKLFLTISTLLTGLLLSGCFVRDLKDKANEQLGEATKQLDDQHFKTTIALVELHKIREGKYPPTLDSLKHLGLIDKTVFNSVQYTRLDSGYALDLVKIWAVESEEDLVYPEDFWKGLGLVRSNLKN